LLAILLDFAQHGTAQRTTRPDPTILHTPSTLRPQSLFLLAMSSLPYGTQFGMHVTLPHPTLPFLFKVFHSEEIGPDFSLTQHPEGNLILLYFSTRNYILAG
jgi:hypothetical protein